MERFIGRRSGGRGILVMMLLVGLMAGALPRTRTAQAVGVSPDIYGVTTGNRLIGFKAATPGTIDVNKRITGLQLNETILGVDLRPSHVKGPLYALGSTSRLYAIDLDTAVARQVGSGVFTTALSGSSFGFDFNPVTDKIRVVSNLAQNLRLGPDNGQILAVDPRLKYAPGDPNASKKPYIGAAAYTNPNHVQPDTVNYAIDIVLNTLVTQGSPDTRPPTSPNTGLLFTRGPLGVVTSSYLGFDISDTNVAYAAITRPPVNQNMSELYTINLATGRAVLVGTIGIANQKVLGIAIDSVPVVDTTSN